MDQSKNGVSNLFSDDKEEDLSSKNRILSLLFCCLVAGFIAYLMIPVKEGVRDLWGRVQTVEELKKHIIISILVSYPVISFIIGALLSFIPYKQRKYRDKYIPFSLSALLALYCLIILFRVASLILIRS